MRKRHLPHLQETGYPLFITFRTDGIVLPAPARQVVVDAARHFDGARYELHHVVCMPDHVHVILKPTANCSDGVEPVSRIVHGLKSYSTHQVNRLMRRKGRLWQRGYYDRIIRSEKDFEQKLRYAVENPLRAGLVEVPEDYQYMWNRWYHGGATDWL